MTERPDPEDLDRMAMAELERSTRAIAQRMRAPRRRPLAAESERQAWHLAAHLMEHRAEPRHELAVWCWHGAASNVARRQYRAAGFMRRVAELLADGFRVPTADSGPAAEPAV